MTGQVKHKAKQPFPTQIKKPDLFSATTNPASRISTWLKTNTAAYRFLFSNFRYYLTLFSKFFSSFPHGTCSLSVSHPYLALDGIYHPLRAAIPNNSTRWRPVVHQIYRHERGFHPPRRLIRQHFVRISLVDLTSPDYNSEDFQSELFRLHSQLLTESLLVSFPPLSNMLKFGGYSCLIGGPIG